MALDEFLCARRLPGSGMPRPESKPRALPYNGYGLARSDCFRALTAVGEPEQPRPRGIRNPTEGVTGTRSRL